MVPLSIPVGHADVVSDYPCGREPRLGIDIGRVIINGPAHPGGGDTAFFQGDEAALIATPEMDGAGPAIARLTDLFEGRVWLVSKCGPRVQARTLRWLDGHDFYSRTGLPPQNVRFCLTRPAKRGHCNELSLTHFVDDHPEVHAAIRGTVDHQYFFGTQADPVPEYGIHAPTWAQVESLITGSVAMYRAGPGPRQLLSANGTSTVRDIHCASGGGGLHAGSHRVGRARQR